MINRHHLVRMSLVRGRQNTVTGSIVVAEVVLKAEEQGAANQAGSQIGLKDDIVIFCRETLPPHKVPAAISFVPTLNVGATHKLLRRPQ